MPRILAFLLALTLIACSGDDDSPRATPTPASETTPGPGAFATAVAQQVTLPVQRVPIRWVPEASPFDIANAGNPDAPFSARAADLHRGEPAAGPDEWQIGLVQGNAAPHIIHRTRKGLLSLSWPSGLRAGLLTERPVPSSLLGVSGIFRWQGSVEIDVASGQSTEKLNPFPDTIDTVVEGSPLAVSLRPGGQSMVVSFSRPSGLSGPPPVPMPGPPEPVSTHLIDAQGNSRRLEGLPDAASLAPLASGRALISGPDRAGRVFLVPVQDGDALVVTMVSGMAVENIPGSTTNRRVFLSLNAGATGTYAIYDSTTHTLRDIGRGPWPGQGAQGTWMEPGKVNAGTEYIDVNTGRREPIPRGPSQILEQTPQAVPSPDKLYVLHTIPPVRTDPPSAECEGLPLKLELEEAGTRRSVYECAGGNPATVTWLDNSHALVRSSRCRGGCDDQAGGLLLVDAATGSVVPLTQGWVEGPYALLSPDKTRLLAGGESLAVYTLAGARQRTIEPPAGFRITTPVWSPDGASFAYLVSPRGWYFFGP